MKKLVLLLAGLAATGPTFAADMPIKAVRPAVPLAYNWTGFYAGLNAGYAWGRSNISSTLDPVLTLNRQTVGEAASPSLDPNGFIGGGQIGYNYQVNQFVLGLEADFDYFHLSDSQASTTTYPVLGGTFNSYAAVRTDWLFTLRPRLGYAVDNFLIYGTGGLAVTRVKYDEAFSDFTGAVDNFSVSETKTGWTAGGGVEYALRNNWSLKAEYLYAHFGSISAAPLFSTSTSTLFRHDVPLNANIVRVGANYKFN